MKNPFKPEDRIVLTATDVMNMLGAKEAELMIARQQIQNAVQIIEQLKAKVAELEGSAKPVPNAVK